MSIPLSQLMQNPDDPDLGPPTATFELCLSAVLAEELEKATEEYAVLEAQLEAAKDHSESQAAQAADGGGRRVEKGRRLGHKPDRPSIAELEEQTEAAAARADAIRERMAEKSVTLHLVADEDAFASACIAHPARDRESDPSGFRLDVAWASGLADVDSFQDVLEQFIVRFGDEPKRDGMWAFARSKSAAGSRRQLVSKIVQLHVQGPDLGKSRVGLRSSLRTATDSE